MNIYPSILSSNLAQVTQQLEIAEQAEGITTVQVDILDGIYADNITISPVDIADSEFGSLTVDFHLMVDDSYDYLHEIESNHTLLPVRAIITQVERLLDPARFLHEVKQRDWLAGLSLNLDTPLGAIDDDWWEQLGIIQVMGIDAGFQGQIFQEKVLPLVTEIKKRVQMHSWPIEIIVDGGVKKDNLAKISAAGASAVAVGSGLWQTENSVESIREFISLSR